MIYILYGLIEHQKLLKDNLLKYINLFKKK